MIPFFLSFSGNEKGENKNWKMRYEIGKCNGYISGSKDLRLVRRNDAVFEVITYGFQ